jgi:hypothetical protein
LDRAIESFYEWFRVSGDELARARTESPVVAELDERVHALDPRLSWEIGPGTQQDHCLAISPNGDAALIELCRKITQSAPLINGWEFRPFRQPKNHPFVVEWDLQDAGLTVDPDTAEYVLLRFADGTYDMYLRVSDGSFASHGDATRFGFVLVESVIGEEARMALIRNVEVVRTFPARVLGRETRLAHLRAHIDQLLTKMQRS